MWRYETDKTELMQQILECAYRDREQMIIALEDVNDAPEYKAECEALCRDIIRMDANLKLGVFGEDAVYNLDT